MEQRIIDVIGILIGMIIGGCIGYFLGITSKDRIENENRISKKEKTSYDFDKLVDDYNSCEFRIAKQKNLIKEILLEIAKDERRKHQIIDIWQKEPKKR